VEALQGGALPIPPTNHSILINSIRRLKRASCRRQEYSQKARLSTDLLYIEEAESIEEIKAQVTELETFIQLIGVVIIEDPLCLHNMPGP
jgi:hypothetical protein